jgi:hypothetical protein
MNQNTLNNKYKFVKTNATATVQNHAQPAVTNNFRPVQNNFKLVNPNVPKQQPVTVNNFKYVKTNHAPPPPARFEPPKPLNIKTALPVLPPTANKSSAGSTLSNSPAISSILKSSSKLDELIKQCREIGSKSSSTTSTQLSSPLVNSALVSLNHSTESTRLIREKTAPSALPQPILFNPNPYKTVNTGSLNKLLFIS